MKKKYFVRGQLTGSTRVSYLNQHFRCLIYSMPFLVEGFAAIEVELCLNYSKYTWRSEI